MNNKDKLIEEFWYGKQLYQGERGGKYYLNESGNKIYVNESRRNRKELRKTKPNRTYKPRPGAFQRYLRHQQELQ
jgi:hypothetical protein